MSIDIEPIEVLAHLHNLGYYDVSSEQLLAFVADLKKLIKYDAKKCNCSQRYMSEGVHENAQSLNSKETSHSVNYLQNSTTRLCAGGRFNRVFHSDNPLQSSHGKICTGGHSLIANKLLHTRGHTQMPDRDMQSDNSCSSKEFHIGSSLNQVASSLDYSRTTSDISKENAEIGCSYGGKASMKTCQRNKCEPSVDFCIGGRKTSGSTKCEKTCNNSKDERKRVLQSNRCMSSTGSRSAFIKPWQLQVPAPQRKSDPVALYHKYQAIWQQQKLPGDNHHDSLRWNVRAKMLGGDPHPRPISRATSAEKVNRPAWNFR